MVELDALSFAADFELVLDFGVLDAAADVGEGECDFFAFKNDRLFFCRRWHGLDAEAGVARRRCARHRC